MSESHENTTVNAAILCLSVCVSDIMNKASTCDRSVYYIKQQPFLFFVDKEQTSMAVPLGAEIGSKNVLMLRKY